jgi:hypothetical protein
MPQKNRTCSSCPAKIYSDNLSGRCRPCYDKYVSEPVPISTSPAAHVSIDREKHRSVAELSLLKKKYEETLRTIDRQEQELRALGAIGDGIDTFTIEPKQSSRTSEATPILVASDWHTEEVVKPVQVSGLNEFNADICAARVTKFFRSSLRLIDLLAQDVSISTVILALLGDFITNDLHEEAAETNQAHPIHAIINVQNQIASGIEFLLAHSSYSFVVPCKVGNHSRTTKKVRFGTESGHSLEYLMYVHLAAYFRHEPRVQFQISEGYHHYINIYDQVIRFHHGHAIKYGGGIGGIFIPTFKAISQWNKGRQADLDVFGHFHQSKDGGNFICNGSLVGYNAFALSIKADYEPPKQTLLLIDKKRKRTCTWPILVG